MGGERILPQGQVPYETSAKEKVGGLSGEGSQLEFDLDKAGEIQCPVVIESYDQLFELRRRAGECVQCGTKLPMSWKGLGECPRCNE